MMLHIPENCIISDMHALYKWEMMILTGFSVFIAAKPVQEGSNQYEAV